MKRVFAAALVFLLSAALCLTAFADGIPELEDVGQTELPAMLDSAGIGSPYAVLYEPFTGTFLFEKDADTAAAPASVTKVMSLLLVMEALQRGELTTDDKVTCSPYAASMGGSQIWLEPGETMSVDDLLKAVAVGSANDATVALAEHLCGSEEAFVARMNERAAQLNMFGTRYMNCSGLDEDGHYTTARDTALASAELIKHELIRHYSTIWMDTLRGGETELVNTNRLVRFYSGITGLKTGTTSKAGCCLSATAEREGLSLVAVVFGAANSDMRFSDARKLLDYGFANYTLYRPQAIDPVKLEVEGGTELEVEVAAGDIAPILLKKSEAKGVRCETSLPQKLTAPVAEGEQVGRVEVKTADGAAVGGYSLVACGEVGKLTWGVAFLKLLLQLICMQ